MATIEISIVKCDSPMGGHFYKWMADIFEGNKIYTAEFDAEFNVEYGDYAEGGYVVGQTRDIEWQVTIPNKEVNVVDDDANTEYTSTLTPEQRMLYASEIAAILNDSADYYYDEDWKH